MKWDVFTEVILCIAAGIIISIWVIALLFGDGSVGIYRLLGYE